MNININEKNAFVKIIHGIQGKLRKLSFLQKKNLFHILLFKTYNKQIEHSHKKIEF